MAGKEKRVITAVARTVPMRFAEDTWARVDFVSFITLFLGIFEKRSNVRDMYVECQVESLE
jgi:hypothetical protein